GRGDASPHPRAGARGRARDTGRLGRAGAPRRPARASPAARREPRRLGLAVGRWAAVTGLLAIALVPVALLAAGSHARGAARDATFFTPVWSADGAHIAWGAAPRASFDPHPRLWMASVAGHDAHPVGKSLDSLGQLAWLPSGDLLADVDFRLVRVSSGGAERTVGTVTDMTFTTDAAGDEPRPGRP